MDLSAMLLLICISWVLLGRRLFTNGVRVCQLQIYSDGISSPFLFQS